MPSPTLVIQTAFLGDVVLTIPLLRALAAEHGPVDVITTPGAASLIETHPSVRRVIRWDKHGKNGPGAWGLGRELAKEGYRRVYLPHRSVRSALIAKLTGAPDRIGFADAPLLARLLYTRQEPRAKSQHESVRLLGLLGPAQSSRLSAPWEMSLTDIDRAKAREWMAANGIAPGFVAMAPGSIWGTKRWPYYPELATLLDRQVVVIGGPEDASLGDAIVNASPMAKSSVGRLSLRQSAALIKEAALLVTNDSAPLHLATAVGTPILAIFGPTVPAFGYGPIRPGDQVAEIPMDCRPCSLHGPQVCPLGHHNCMKDQTPAAILLRVRSLLR
jgi:heptosyltransferase-2